MSAAAPLRHTMPYPLISRFSSEFHLSGTALSLALMPGQFDASVVAAVLLRRALDSWIVAGALAMPAGPVAVGSVNAVARSLARSPETVRRLCTKLTDAGIGRVGAGGFVLDPDAAAGARILRYLAGVHDITLRMLDDLMQWGVLAGTAPGREPAERDRAVRAVLGVGMDMSLVPFEVFSPIDDWTTMAVWNALSTMTVRHVTVSAELSRRFAYASTPDDMRRDFPLRAIMRTVGISYGTTWRHMMALEAAGMVTRRGDRWLVGAGELQDDATDAAVASGADYFLRRLRGVVALRLTATDIGRHYLVGRPDLHAIA